MSVPPAFALAALRIHPNAVTVAGGLVGLAALGAVVSQKFLLGALLLQVWLLSDFVDGSVARIRGRPNRWGGFLDGAVHHQGISVLLIPSFAISLWYDTGALWPLAFTGIYLWLESFRAWNDRALDIKVMREWTDAHGDAPWIEGSAPVTGPAPALWRRMLQGLGDYAIVTMVASAVLIAQAFLASLPLDLRTLMIALAGASMLARIMAIARGYRDAALARRRTVTAANLGFRRP